MAIKTQAAPTIQICNLARISEDPKNALIRRDCMSKEFYLPSTLVKFGNRGTIPLGGALGGALMVSEIKEKITQIAGPNDYRFRNFPQLDGFRGLAIALVMCGHMMSFASGS